MRETMIRATLAPIRSTAARFSGDNSGAVALLFGVALLPVMLVAGAAIDYSQATSAVAELQRAADAAALAGAMLKLDDDKRERKAEQVFDASLSPRLSGHIASRSFPVDGTKTRIEGVVTAKVPNAFMGLIGKHQTTVKVEATSLIAKPEVRQLDLVMCIDATGSMQPTIDAVKGNALTFETNLNAELTKRSIEPFEAMRVKVVFYRDYGGNTWYDPEKGGWAYTKDGWRYIEEKDPDRARYVGDLPPMKISDFHALPDERNGFASFVQPENAQGGGDLPESGLECVNEGIDTKWAKVKDQASGKGKKLTSVHPVVVVWTDADAQPPSHKRSLANPDYPGASKMPRDYVGLTAKWNDPQKIDQNNKMLVFFGKPTRPGWAPLNAWGGFVHGGTLVDGTSQMVTKIADAIASKLASPTLTH